MKKIFKKELLVYALIWSILIIPTFVFAQQSGGAGNLVPCDGTDCDIDDFMTLIFNVINFAIFLGVIFSSLAFAFAGFLYITAQGDTSKVQRATKIFTGVAVGLFLAFTAFLVIQLITTSLGLKVDRIPIILK